MYTKGYAAIETKDAFEQARTLIERAEALGEAPEDPLAPFSVIYGFWLANAVAFKADAVRELAAQILSLAEKQGAAVPLAMGIACLAFHWCIPATSRKDERISIARSGSTTLLSIVQRRRDLA